MSTHVVRRDPYGGDSNEIRRTIVRGMNRLRAYRLEGEYSGGHDEGGLQDLVIYDKAGAVIDVDDASTRDELWVAIDNLLSTKFYTWALEGYVHGKVYVDLTEKRAWTEGQEEYTEYRDDPDPIEMSW